MSTDFSIQGKNVQNIYDMYLKGKFVVNRRYQRKLVWLIEEKEKFIDSLLHGYPIPLILTSKSTEHTDKFEILDGLQRLNAVTSFIEGEFSVKGKYFDLESTALTKTLKDQGIIKQKRPTLLTDDCSKILNYEIPVSTSSYVQPSVIDETFRRINTGGRRLSKHDVRQAGALDSFPQLVSEIAMEIRRDSTRTNIIQLEKMKNISISDKKLDYGIKMQDIFWVKQGIINHENIRCSRDEELIAHILSYILLDKNSKTTSEFLDKLYEKDSNESLRISAEINKYTPELIKEKFMHVFNEINEIFKNRTRFKEQLYNGNAAKSARTFQVLFLSIYKLLIADEREIINYKNVHAALKTCYEKHMKNLLNNNEKWSNEDRASLIKTVSGLISDETKSSDRPQFQPGIWIKNLENILNESKTEQQYYDFKSGLVQTSPPESYINNNTFSKVIKTLTAMTNSTDGESMVIIGVAEAENGANNYKSAYKKDFISYSSFYIVGIEDEAIKTSKSIDGYINKIRNLIDKEPISDNFKSILKNNLVNFNYSGKEILILKASKGEQPEVYNKKLWIREASNLKEIELGSSDFNQLLKRFNK